MVKNADHPPKSELFAAMVKPFLLSAGTRVKQMVPMVSSGVPL